MGSNKFVIKRAVIDDNINFADASQLNVYSASQGINIGTVAANRVVVGQRFNRIHKVENHVEIDEEVANLLTWLSEQQGITPELALKKAVATAAYIHDITTSQGGRLLVQRKDNSVGEIVLK